MKHILIDKTENLNLNLSNFSYSNEERENLKKGNQQGSLTKHIALSETKEDLKYDVKNPNFLYFLGGFVEGEGSNSVSISVGKLFKYGVNLQPVFNVTQHENGLKILHAYKNLFGAGSVLQKSGSPHIWVYTIKGYKHIILRVIPFLETYVQPYSCKVREYQLFKKLVIMSAEGNQKNKDTLIEMVQIAYTLIGKGKGRKRTLEEVLEIIKDKDSYFKNLNI